MLAGQYSLMRKSLLPRPQDRPGFESVPGRPARRLGRVSISRGAPEDLGPGPRKSASLAWMHLATQKPLRLRPGSMREAANEGLQPELAGRLSQFPLLRRKLLA